MNNGGGQAGQLTHFLFSHVLDGGFHQGGNHGPGEDHGIFFLEFGLDHPVHAGQAAGATQEMIGAVLHHQFGIGGIPHHQFGQGNGRIIDLGGGHEEGQIDAQLFLFRPQTIFKDHPDTGAFLFHAPVGHGKVRSHARMIGHHPIGFLEQGNGLGMVILGQKEKTGHVSGEGVDEIGIGLEGVEAGVLVLEDFFHLGVFHVFADVHALGLGAFGLELFIFRGFLFVHFLLELGDFGGEAFLGPALAIQCPVELHPGQGHLARLPEVHGLVGIDHDAVVFFAAVIHDRVVEQYRTDVFAGIFHHEGIVVGFDQGFPGIKILAA